MAWRATGWRSVLSEHRKRVATGADVLAAATVVVVLAVSAIVMVRQGNVDDEARAVARWALARDVTRVAWPASLRRAVPALLEAGVVPVLVDDAVPDQQFAVADTEVVVTSGGQDVAFSTESMRTGAVSAHVVDLDRAGAEPLAVGDTVGEEISRPYRYAPLRPSEVVAPGEAFSRELTLLPGRYEVEVEGYVGIEAEAPTPVVVALGVEGEELVGGGGTADKVVEQPIVADLTVPESSTTRVTLAIGPVGGPGSPDLLIHAWRVTRMSGP